MFFLFRFLICLVVLGFAAPAFAQSGPNSGPNTGNQPFTIEANDSLEYQQTERVYIAKGRAKVARPGNGPDASTPSITADTLTAYERDKPGGKKKTDPSAANPTSNPLAQNGGGNSEIWKFVADGTVVIDNGNPAKPAKGYGDHATYDIDSQRAILTGRNLHMDSDNETSSQKITARDSFEYLTNTREAIANGDAKAVQTPKPGNPNQATRTVTADTLHVFFTEDQSSDAAKAESGISADRMEARGHVKITTVTPATGGAAAQTSVATSDSAIFNNNSQTAQLSGNVQIARGQNQLAGDRAEIDLNSGVSKLLAAPQASDEKGQKSRQPRVRGLLIPGGGSGNGTSAGLQLN